jgi:hypothetical protein
MLLPRAAGALLLFNQPHRQTASVRTNFCLRIRSMASKMPLVE